MTLLQLLAELRLVVDDTVSGDYAWSDATLSGYLAEGQDKFCEDTGYFRDSTNYTVTLQTGVATYDLSDRFIQLIQVWDGYRRLGKIVADGPAAFDDWPTTFDTSATGLPAYWRTDKSTGVLELYPAPTVYYNGRVLTLQAWRYSRYPLDRMSSTITLAGTLHAGDVIAATINGTVYSYTALGSEGSLSAVATALAAVIDASATLVASASGQVISVSALSTEDSTSATVAVSGAGATITAAAVDYYSASSELPGRLQRACIEWAAAKARNHKDMDTYDSVKAMEHESNFQKYVSDGIRQFRRLHNEETRVGTDPAYRT